MYSLTFLKSVRPDPSMKQLGNNPIKQSSVPEIPIKENIIRFKLKFTFLFPNKIATSIEAARI
jgi:hypothetical protein